jgi:hypothetical protein
MKKTLIFSSLLVAFGATSQVKTPQLSPVQKMEQTIGLTTINIEYSRPSARGRVVFPDVVPFDEIWRTGANKNTLITISDVMIFGKDTLRTGTYSIFVKPGKSEWKVYFYKTIENWGTPDVWEDSQVVLSIPAKVSIITNSETFTIAINDITIKGGTLQFIWGTTAASVGFDVATDVNVEKSIAQTLAGPTAGDYYRSADYYYNAKKDMKQALEWISKSIDMQKDAPYYQLRKKALIQAELKDFKGAVATSKIGLEKAKKAESADYVKAFEDSIKEWSK